MQLYDGDTPTTLRPGDMLIYLDRRITIWRTNRRLSFAGGTMDTFLVPQIDNGFLLASVISYVTGMDFETREHLGVRAFLFKPKYAARTHGEPVRRIEHVKRLPRIRTTA